jgi:hypothetical protein
MCKLVIQCGSAGAVRNHLVRETPSQDPNRKPNVIVSHKSTRERDALAREGLQVAIED